MTLERLSWPVLTERLLIRPATPGDAGALWTYRSDPATAEWLTRLPTDRAAFGEWFSTPDVLGLTLVVELDGEVVGDLFLHVGDAWAQAEVASRAAEVQAEIGWSLAPAYRGLGYAQEAVTALLGLCFDDLGLHRVVAECFAVNEPSWRLMERLGMRREAHTVADALHREHGWMDGFSYAILAEEWASPRAG